MNVNILSQNEAVALAKQQMCLNKTKLVAMDYNWGPPIGGRFDTDHMNFWAKVKTSETGKLYLQGMQYNLGWNINTPFTLVGNFVENNSSNEFSLYQLSLGSSQYAFPQEFVLRFDADNGNQYYDNNGGNNYQISPSVGYGSSALCDDTIIFDLGEIIGYKMYSAIL